MVKKVLRLTESELREVVEIAVGNSLNETDGGVYGVLRRASIRAQQVQLNGDPNQDPQKFNLGTIKAETKLESAANDTFIAPYKTTYLFHSKDLSGFPVLVSFTLECLFKLSPTEVILKGLVILNENATLSKDEKIVVTPGNGETYYIKHDGNRNVKYYLHIDPSKRDLWNKLLCQIQHVR